MSGDVLPVNFGNGGALIYYAFDPQRRRIWMDGRLELEPLSRFDKLHEYRTRMLSASQAADPKALALPPSVRFLVVPIDDVRRTESLNDCGRFRLLYVDQAGVCFARIPQPGESVTWPVDEKLPPANLEEFDVPLDPPTRRRLLPVPVRRRWYRQNVPPAHWRMGALFYTLGLDDLAIRYLTVADRLKLEDPLPRMGMLAQAHQRLSEYRPLEPDWDLPTDPNLSRALALYEKMDLTDLSDPQARAFALVRIRGLIRGRQIDAAQEAMRRYMQALPIPLRWKPSPEALAVRDSIKAGYDAAVARRGSFHFRGLTPLERATLLLRKDLGLIDHAIAELRRSTSLPPAGRRLLGDLYLRKGLTGAARREYGHLGSGGADLLLRLGLCDWADGDFAGALTRLRRCRQVDPTAPEPVLYLALLEEQLGDYAAAVRLLDGYRPPQAASRHVRRLLAQVRARVWMRSGKPPPTRPPAATRRAGPAATDPAVKVGTRSGADL